MAGAISETPTVSLSFANNFWGKDDAGVHPLLERMHGAKVTSDEVKSFYTGRAQIEDEYARKLLSLCRKPLGSCESGTLRASLDTMRGEVESMGKAHQSIAAQMKSELEEPLAAFAGGLKERRKIVQSGIEKLLKVKVAQAQQMNKSRDRYEQDCLRIKGYLAQGHMVMGQEERKNKAKLEKTQIQVATSNNEYEAAVKALDETTGRWNRDWKAACDKFQDLEEERLDFMKSSLWSLANIASTVCVSDDASCEKIRLQLEGCEVEKDIVTFIRDKGTGQEIPDPPKYINFCRGDVNDTSSEASDDDTYSVAQFQRTINPAFRSSSPQPSTYESHHDPSNELSAQIGRANVNTPPSRETTLTPQTAMQSAHRPQQVQASRHAQAQAQVQQAKQQAYEQVQQSQLAQVPHNEYPMDGMTMLCRTGPPSGRSSATSPQRRSSRDSQSEYSNPTSLSSQEPASGKQSPVKPGHGSAAYGGQMEAKQVQKKKSGFFQGHSPFRRKSKHEKENPLRSQRQDEEPSIISASAKRNTWSAASSRNIGGGGGPMNASPTRRAPHYTSHSASIGPGDNRRGGTPEPVDPRANFQLNIGNNVFDVASPDGRSGKPTSPSKYGTSDELDPIAQALAELKGVTKQSSVRMSADRYAGLQTPAPASVSSTSTPLGHGAQHAAQRGTPPPSYDQPMKRLDLPEPAFTSAQMKQTRQQYIDHAQNVFGQGSAPASYGAAPSHDRQGARSSTDRHRGHEMPRATSPAPPRSVSPRPAQQGNSEPRQAYRSVSPMPYAGSGRSRHQSASPHKRQSDHGYDPSRPQSSDMQIQLSPGPDDRYGAQRGVGSRPVHRPQSYYGGSPPEVAAPRQQAAPHSHRARSKSMSDGRQFNRDGRPILHFARALYMYQAAIPEELSFAKGDVLAVLRLQDDGWWEAEVAGKNGRSGLVPSNYLQNC